MIDLKQAAPDLVRSVCVYLPNSVLINHLHASWQSRGDISLCQAARNTSSNHLALPACRLWPASCTAGDLPNSVLSSCVGRVCCSLLPCPGILSSCVSRVSVPGLAVSAMKQTNTGPLQNQDCPACFLDETCKACCRHCQRERLHSETRS